MVFEKYRYEVKLPFKYETNVNLSYNYSVCKNRLKTLLNNTFKNNTNLLSVYDNIMKERANLNTIEPVINYQLKILFRAYNFIIKSITRSLIILRNRERWQTISSITIYSFTRFSGHHQSVYNNGKSCYGYIYILQNLN